MTRRRSQLVLAALFSVALLLPVGDAAANKVGNPGNFHATVTDGTLKVGSQTFSFDDDDPAQTISFDGSIAANGNVTIPESGAHFPTIALNASGFDVTVHINVADPITGNIDPITGAGNLNLRVWIKIDGVPLGGDCRIASDGSPITVNPLVTGTSGPVSGTLYNPSNGTIKLANGTYSVPESSSCGPGGGSVNSAVGIPSASGNNTAEFSLDFTPTLTKGVNATFTATPPSGFAPHNVTFNPSGSTAVTGIRSCGATPTPATTNCGVRWDFDGNGTDDLVTNTATNVTNNYLVPGTYTVRERVYDAQQDFDQTTRTVTVNIPPPDLTIDKSHTGNFFAGTNETYTLAVSNGGNGATAGTTVVTDTLPVGTTFVSGTGTGWTCSAVAQAVTCSRTGNIAAGGSAPSITLTVAVASGAASSITNVAAVATPTEINIANNGDSDPTTVNRIDMGIVKTALGTFETGTVETYELALTQSGDVATTGITTVGDTLPSGLTYIDSRAPAGWTCGATGQTVTCDHPAGIPAGYAESIEIDVVAGAVAVPSVNNVATVATTDDSTAANNSSSVTTPVTATVDLTIDKSHSGPFRVGSSASYTIAVQNRGARPSAGTTTVTDTLPAGLTYVDATGTGWSCGASGQDVTCDRADSLAAGQSADLLTINVDVSADALPAVTNTANVSTAGSGADADSNTANDSDADPTTVTATDLTVDKSHVGGFPIAGQGTYTLSVRNDGGAATAGTTTVTDTLPAELSFVNATGSGWSCGAVGQDVTCTRAASIAAGQTAPAITLVVDVANTEEESTTNSASVSTSDDINSANDSDTDPTPLTAADLEVTKTHSGSFRVGSSRAYVIRVGNVGSQPTTGTSTVTDTLPEGLTYVGATGSGWSCGAVGQDVTCTRATAIASGANAPAITIQVAVGTAAYPSVTNDASVSNADDRNNANDVASDPTTVTASDLTLTKTHLGSLQVNDRASYLIRVDNDGTAATNSPATVTDTLPAGLTYAGSPSGDWDCSAAGQTVTCEQTGSIDAGAHSDVEILADVGESAADEVTNAAAVALTGDPDTSDNSDDDVADVGRIDLSIDKGHTGDLPRGGTGTYAIAVGNDGSDATDGPTHVSDTLPSGLSYAGATGTGWSCSVSAGTVDCAHAGSIAGGAAAAPISLQVDVAPGAPPTVSNTASVTTSDDADSSNDSDTDPADVTLGRDAAISIRPQIPAGGSFQVGSHGTYTVAVRNAGSGAIPGPVTATATLPAGLSYVSGTGGDFACSVVGQQVTCTDANGMGLDTRTDIDLEVDVAKAASPGVTTTAEVSAPGDTVASNDDAQAVTPVTMIDAAISMQHTGTFALSTQSSFVINVENVGSAATVTPTKVIDTLPAGLTFASASGAGWTCAQAGQTSTCTFAAALAAGAQATPLTLSVTPQASVASQSLTNSASVVTKDDAEASNDTASDSVTVGAAPQQPQVQGQVGTSAKCSKKKPKKGKKAKKCKKKKKKK